MGSSASANGPPSSVTLPEPRAPGEPAFPRAPGEPLGSSQSMSMTRTTPSRTRAERPRDLLSDLTRLPEREIKAFYSVDLAAPLAAFLAFIHSLNSPFGIDALQVPKEKHGLAVSGLSAKAPGASPRRPDSTGKSSRCASIWSAAARARWGGEHRSHLPSCLARSSHLLTTPQWQPCALLTSI